MSKRLDKKVIDAKDIDKPTRETICICALEKSGKTHVSLTPPDPILYLDFDNGLPGVVGKFSDKVIKVIHYQYDKSPQVDQEVHEKLWNEFVLDYYEALLSPKYKTIVIDSASTAWELLRLKEFGRAEKIMSFEYGPVNAIYRDLLTKASLSDKNLILLQRVKKEFEGPSWNGKYIINGFNQTGFEADMNVLLNVDDKYRFKAKESKNNKFSLTVLNSRHNHELAGIKFKGDNIDLTNLIEMALDI